MHERVLPAGSRDVLAALEGLRSRELEGWTLAGGTGLALQVGHRLSEDFEFSRVETFVPDRLHRRLRTVEATELLQLDEGTLTVRLGGVKLSFFSVPDPFLFASEPCRFFELADVRDIALMKLAAISIRGSRNDFVDLYTILRGGLELEQCFVWLPQKYGEGRLNSYHVLKSLTWFSDAEREPMPRMLEPFDWEECTSFFVREAHAIVLP